MSSNPNAPDARRRRSAARLAAVQALYQQSVAGTATPRLLNEFHNHRLGAEIETDEGEDRLTDADRPFFDDLVSGSLARADELDETITRFLGAGWSLDRLDRLMLQILRCGAYEMLARPDVPRAAVVSEYVDVAHAFYEAREAGFVNALLDRLGKSVRAE
ncbi:transcription antitermination factor NusB [Sandaracinobacter sp. RS1-74]|uniref:transcription antitermination factor NusB n=1 Tax=Sandaracinobacteroides sayramensis TaxID=2913411 RepID=UPI001EDB9B8A|nr:transcription antitermination factor NusB [Sandaracinobacteroides sayramensis]MCG2842337.1 transcription antitermination factor NusB [Sandaracinobacteroides sayramensis]